MNYSAKRIPNITYDINGQLINESAIIERRLIKEMQAANLKNDKKIKLLQKVIDVEERGLNAKLNDISSEYGLISKSLSICNLIREFNKDVDTVMKLSRDTEEYKRHQQLKRKQSAIGNRYDPTEEYVSAKFEHLKMNIGGL